MNEWIIVHKDDFEKLKFTEYLLVLFFPKYIH